MRTRYGVGDEVVLRDEERAVIVRSVGSNEYTARTKRGTLVVAHVRDMRPVVMAEPEQEPVVVKEPESEPTSDIQQMDKAQLLAVAEAQSIDVSPEADAEEIRAAVPPLRRLRQDSSAAT